MNRSSKSSGTELLNNKKFVMIISLVLAVLFWFAITVMENPESERVVSGIKLYFDTSGTIVEEQKLSAIGYDENTAVSVKISGASYIVNSITADDILVSPSFEDVNASGKYSLKLSATNNTSKNFAIESVTPQKIDVEFDYIDTTSYNVSTKVINAAASDGLVLGKERFTNSENATLEVSGPRSKVSQISEAVAEVKADKKEKLSATKSYEAEVKLYDSEGKEISKEGLELSFETISVSVPVYKTKVVPIKCTYVNNASAYVPKSEISVDGKVIDEIEIEGAPELMDKISYVELEPIDFRSVYKDCEPFNVKFVLPSGVFTVNDATSAKVTLDTDLLASKMFKVSNIKVVNNKNGYKVSLNKKIEVKMCGPSNILSDLSANNLYAEIDLDGKTLGEQNLSVTVKSNIKDNVWQITECNAKITVSE